MNRIIVAVVLLSVSCSGRPVFSPSWIAQVDPRGVPVGDSVAVEVLVYYEGPNPAQTDVTVRTLDPEVLAVGPDAVGDEHYLWPLPAPLATQRDSFDFTCIAQGSAVIEVSVTRSHLDPARLLVECGTDVVIASITDPIGDFIDSVPDFDPERREPHVDLVGIQAGTVEQEEVDEHFPCAGEGVHCGAETPSGQSAHFTSVLDDVLPDELDHLLVYSIVARTDDESINDWLPQGPFGWDVYQGTDRWWVLTHDPATGWSVDSSRVEADQSITAVETAARAVVQAGRIEFFVPWTELGDGDRVEYRVTTFAAGDATYPQDDRGGDVPGPNPTGPLLTLTR